MKKAGRANWIVVFAVLALVLVVGLAFFSGGSPAGAASEFLTALQKRDIDTLTELSNVPESGKAALRKQWKFNAEVAAPYYNFAWEIQHTKQITSDQAVVAVKVIRNSEDPNAYDEPFELAMVKVDGQWKVDIYRLSRNFYPALPRMPGVDK